MNVQDVEKNKPATKQKYKLPTLEEYDKKIAGTPVSTDLVGPGAPQTDESKIQTEEWNQLGPLGKLGRKTQVGFMDLGAGIKQAIGDVLPILGMPPNSPLTPADAMVASQVMKQKALETLERRKEINAPQGDWTDIATMAPMLVGIAAASAAAPFTAGTSLSAMPAIIGQGTMLAMGTSVYGNSLLEQEEYAKATGKEIPEFSKHAVALGSAAAMIVAGEIVGSGARGVSKLFGDAISSSLKESPQLANGMMRRFISETPGAATKLMKLAKVTGAEMLKSGTSFGAMTLAQDYLSNINKYPEDRLAFREIVTDALNSFKGGVALGLILGPMQVGQSEMYNYLRRKKTGITVVQTTDGQTYERIGNHPTDPNKITVLDKNMNFKDIPKETIEDSFSMTMLEKEKYLDAYKTHQEAMPGIEEAIKRNAVKRQTKELTNQLIFQQDKSKKQGFGKQGSIGANIRMVDVNGEKLFVGTISADGRLAELRKVVNNGDGTYSIQKFMVKNFDESKVVDIPASDFAQMAFEAYTTGEAPKESTNKDGSPVDPILRQKAQDESNKAAKVGDEIKYQGRNWEVQEIGFDGTVKVNEIKDNGEFGETMEIPPDMVKDINPKKFEEPAVETVTVDGVKTTAHAGPPVYEKDGEPVSKGYIRGAIRTARTPMDLSGLRWDNDEELAKMYKDKFPEMIQTYSIGKDEVERDEVEGAINHASDPKDLKDIKINLDPEMQGKLDAKLASLQPVENIQPPKAKEEAAPAAEGTTAAPAVAEKKAEVKPKEKTIEEKRSEELNAVDKQSGEKKINSISNKYLQKGQESLNKGIEIFKRIGYSSENQKFQMMLHLS